MTTFTQYEEYLSHVLQYGRSKTDRTNTGTVSVFGYQMRWNLQHGFPLVTTKKLSLKSIIAELIWFLEGSTDNNRLRELGATIWDEWAAEDGSLGPIYGQQWRAWRGAGEPYTDSDSLNTTVRIDQIQEALNILKKSPDSRRIVVNSWNVADLPEMSLLPCHCLFQLNTEVATVEERELYVRSQYGPDTLIDLAATHEEFDKAGVPKLRCNLQLYQRSCDSFLGVPYNIASYSALCMMFAQQADMIPGDFIWTGGDCHIYSNHMEQVMLQLGRSPYPAPDLKIQKAPSMFEYKLEDFQLNNYLSHPVIRGEVAV